MCLVYQCIVMRTGSRFANSNHSKQPTETSKSISRFLNWLKPSSQQIHYPAQSKHGSLQEPLLGPHTCLGCIPPSAGGRGLSTGRMRRGCWDADGSRVVVPASRGETLLLVSGVRGTQCVSACSRPALPAGVAPVILPNPLLQLRAVLGRCGGLRRLSVTLRAVAAGVTRRYSHHVRPPAPLSLVCDEDPDVFRPLPGSDPLHGRSRHVGLIAARAKLTVFVNTGMSGTSRRKMPLSAWLSLYHISAVTINLQYVIKKWNSLDYKYGWHQRIAAIMWQQLLPPPRCHEMVQSV